MSDTTTKPEAWPVYEQTKWDGSEYVPCYAVQFPRDTPGQRFFKTREEAEAFARNPIIQWERDRALELLREVKRSEDRDFEAHAQTGESARGLPVGLLLDINRLLEAAEEGGDR